MMIENSIHNSEDLYKKKYLKYKKKYLDEKLRQEGGSGGCKQWTYILTLVENKIGKPKNNIKNEIKIKHKTNKPIEISSLTSNIIYRFLELTIANMQSIINPTNYSINGKDIDVLINKLQNILMQSNNIHIAFNNHCNHLGNMGSKSSQIKGYYQCFYNIIYHYMVTPKTDIHTITPGKETVPDRKIIKALRETVFDSVKPYLQNYEGKMEDKIKIKEYAANKIGNVASAIPGLIKSMVPGSGRQYAHADALTFNTGDDKKKIGDTFIKIARQFAKIGEIYKNLMSIKNVSIYDIKSPDCKLSHEEINIIYLLVHSINK
jgi:hypothetical protein